MGPGFESQPDHHKKKSLDNLFIEAFLFVLHFRFATAVALANAVCFSFCLAFLFQSENESGKWDSCSKPKFNFLPFACAEASAKAQREDRGGW